MNPVWSPDSKWVVYARQLENSFKAAFAFQVETNERIQLTDGMADVMSPVWDQGGKYLYFLSSTNYGLKTGWLDMSSYDATATYNLYCLILEEGIPSPTLAKSDDEDIAEKSKEEPEKGSKKSKNAKKDEKAEDTKKVADIKITSTNIAERIVALNMPSRNYVSLVAGPDNSVFVLEAIENQRGLSMLKYDLKKDKSEEFLTGINEVVSSSNGGNGSGIFDTSFRLKLALATSTLLSE